MSDAHRYIALAAEGVQRLAPYVPGKPIEEVERELGIRNTVKLASNENPLGPPAASVEAASRALGSAALYPDGSAWALKRGLAAHLNVTPECLTPGNGSNDVLVLLAEAFLMPGRSAIYSQYAFIVYALAVQAASAHAIVVPALPAHHPVKPLGHDLAAMREAVDDRTRLVFIANPNNPTGTWLDAGALRDFIASLPPEVIVVVDEAYAEYVTDPAYASAIGWIDEFPNLVVTRTFSKIYALAGLRVGYAVSHPVIADLLNRVRQPFNVNAPAQAAALAALDDAAHVRRSQQLNAQGRVQLGEGLTALGCQVVPSEGNFLLVRMPVPAMDSYQHLLKAGFIVRPVGNYGLPDHLRITVGLPEQNAGLLAALARMPGIAGARC